MISGEYITVDMNGDELPGPRAALEFARELIVAAAIQRCHPDLDIGVDADALICGADCLWWPEADGIARGAGMADVLAALDKVIATPDRRFTVTEVVPDAEVVDREPDAQLALGAPA